MAEPSPKPRNVYVDDDLWEWVKQQAVAQRVTISRVIRQCIELSKRESDRGASK